jgi:selenocysteine lyase/cysteine desulfurase
MGFAALEAGLSLIGELGIDAIHQHVQGILDPLEQALIERGFTSERAPDPASRSCTLSVRPPPTLDITTVEQPMLDHGVAVSIPDGRLRLAPHWPNSRDQVPQVIAAIDGVLRAARSAG